MTSPRRLLRYAAAVVLYYSGALRCIEFLRQLGSDGRQVIVLGLHRVLSDSEMVLSASEPSIVIRLKTFSQLLGLLKKRYRLIRLGDMEQDSLPRSRRPLCLITFDDAWIDTFQNALPLLESANTPAVVFVPTELIGSGKTFWVEQVRAAWKRGGPPKDEMIRRLRQIVDGAKLFSITEFVSAMKTITAEQRTWVLPDHDSPSPSIDGFMDWAELKEMLPVFEAGSHTATHVLLDCEKPEHSFDELVRSGKQLSERIGGPISAIAYPNGNFNAAVVELTRRAGYRWGFTTRSGRYRQGNDPLRVPRYLLHEENLVNPRGEFSPAMLALRLAL